MKYEVLIGDKATVEALLETYESSKSSHTLKILGFFIDGSADYHILVRYSEKRSFEL